jgi:mono/diheme cytochrome c family protein
VLVADMQGGSNIVRMPDGSSTQTTSGAGGVIIRGHRMPKELQGDYCYGEPVARMVRCMTQEKIEGMTHLHTITPHDEFIKSKDPYFRPVDQKIAPDGTLYIVDMYRGIIQEGNWVKQGSYLRTIVQRFQLDKNFGHGRIWRLRYKGMNLGPQPHMLNETPAQLVTHLTSANGWWRDTAQKLIVRRNDKSVMPALTKMAIENRDPLTRLDALWTLEGLDSVSPEFVRVMLADRNPQVRAAAVRVSESLYKKGDTSLEADVRALAHDPDPNVAIQVMLTANLLKWNDSKKFIETLVASDQALGVQQFGQQILLPPAAVHREFTGAERKVIDRGQVIYNQLCFACHGNNGKGMPLQGGAPGVTMAPPLSGSRTVNGVSDGIIDVLLKGLTGPVDGKNYGSQMVSMQNNDDAWIAAVASYVRNSFGNASPFIEVSEVSRARVAAKDHNAPWTLDELHAILPQALANRAQWKVSASHHADDARLAIDGKIQTRYDTGTPQVPGMWYQIELPESQNICGLRLDAGDSFNDYPRGYKVQLSDDGQAWGEPVASGHGSGVVTEIFFPAAKGKFIRITQTGSVSGLFWSIHELRIFEPGAPVQSKAAAVSAFE